MTPMTCEMWTISAVGRSTVIPSAVMRIELPGYRLAEPLDGNVEPTRADDPASPEGSEDRDETRERLAVVWRAERESDGLPVAIKIFPKVRASLARREAALLATVEHPHVVAVFDVVSGPSHIGVVTELAAAGSLRRLLGRRGRLSWQECLTVLVPVADALAAAHERDVVHGDLSAGNVLFDEAGRPLVCDLGAARAAVELSVPVAATPTDIAPEVARGATPDHRSDMFGLGSIALHCLSGRPAWPAENLTDVVIQSTAGQWPDPDDAIAPEELLDIVRRLLDPDPVRRGSAAAAAIDLRRVGDPEPVDLDPKAPDGRPRLPATVVRPDVAALRRAKLTPPPRRRGIRRPARTGSARADSADPLARGRSSGRNRDHFRPPAGTEGSSPRLSTGSGGRHASATSSGRAPWFSRFRRVVGAVTVVIVLAVGAVRVGLWWAASGRVGPTAVSDVLSSSAAVGSPSANRPGTTESTPVPHTPSGTTTVGVTGVPPTLRTGAAPPSVTVDNVAGTGGVDWVSVVAGLDAARSRAFTERNPELLDLVYSHKSRARAADVRAIAALVAHGYRLTAANHDIAVVTVDVSATVGTAGFPLRVVESLPAADVTDDAGHIRGHTAALPTAPVLLVVVETTDGYRIDAVAPG
jgi:serine/threonine protein kinase